jgi:hypothetical protein
MSDSHEHDRRNVLKMVSGLTGGLTVGAVGTVTADADSIGFGDIDKEDCDCSYEYKCEDACYKDGSYDQSWKRECCTCDGDTVCEDTWTRMNQCCGF